MFQNAVELGVAAVPALGGAASTSLGSFSTTDPTGAAGDTLTREQRHRLWRAAGKEPRCSALTPPLLRQSDLPAHPGKGRTVSHPPDTMDQ